MNVSYDKAEFSVYMELRGQLVKYKIKRLCVHVCCVRARSHSVAQLYLTETPWTVAHQVPLFLSFSSQEYWNELPFPPPGDLPDPGIKPMSPTFPILAGRFFTV